MTRHSHLDGPLGQIYDPELARARRESDHPLALDLGGTVGRRKHLNDERWRIGRVVVAAKSLAVFLREVGDVSAPELEIGRWPVGKFRHGVSVSSSNVSHLARQTCL